MKKIPELKINIYVGVRFKNENDIEALRITLNDDDLSAI